VKNTRSIILASAVAAVLGQRSIPALAQERGALGAIAPQSLDAALRTFARSAGLQVIYVSDATRGRATHGSAAGAAPGDALTQLLAGTGLDFEFINERTVIIRFPGSAATVGARPVELLSSVVVAPAPTAGPEEPNAPAVREQLPATAPTSEIPEIIVTAQRREENIQDVPISVQALTGETLKQLNIQNLDDLIQVLPGVTQGTNGPAQGDIFMRGTSVGYGGGQGAGGAGFLPVVAIYLDEQSGQLPGRNLDVYAADLERIEVLEGPQGTQFGGGALSGVLRYITNKPKIDLTEGNFEAGYGVTAHGDPNTNVTGVINLPLVADHLAVRAVIYSDRQGGYINNLPSTFTRLPTDEGIARYNGGTVPTNSLMINNYNIAANGINPLTYSGLRAQALWKINDDWNVLLSQSYQNMDAQGVFYEMPYSSEGTTFDAKGLPIGKYPLPPLSVNLFNPSYDKDKFEDTALVVSGNISGVKLLYSGAYLDRHVDQQQDYTNYARGVFGYYYQCAGYAKGKPAAGQCYTPSAVWTENETMTHQSHELRASSPDDFRIRGLVGLYWEDYDIADQTFQQYTTVPTCSPTGLNVNCFLPIQPWPGSPSFTPVPPIGYFDDVKRVYKQLAEFASIDVDIIPKVLTLTGGTRHFKYDESETGGDVGSFYCKQFTPTTYFGFCKAPFGSFQALKTTAAGSRSRVNLSWKITPDIMAYGTWSQGFRAGTFNHEPTCHLPDKNGVGQFCTPAFETPDNLTNKELGWKTEWWDHRIQFNGSIYQEDWTNVQTAFFAPQLGFGNLTVRTNGPSYRIRGLEPSVLARLPAGFSVQLSASWNSSSLTNSPYLPVNNPASVNYGQNITSIPNVYGVIGSPTSFSPAFKMFARIRYDWTMSDYAYFVQVNADHQDHMITSTGYIPGYDIPGFSTYGASAGVSRGGWQVQLYAQNLTNVLANVSTSNYQFVETQVPLRPRVLGLKISYSFREK
jgi:iron complex outermembrane receptor protein